MVGNTLKLMVKGTFNSDVGTNVVVEKEFNVVIDK